MKTLVGSKQGKLTITSEHIEKKKRGKYTEKVMFYSAICDCGKVAMKIRKDRLKNKIACKSCTISINSNKKKGGKYITIPHYSVKLRAYKSYIRRAKYKSLLFNLTEKQCFKLFDSICHYCGIEPQEVNSTTDNGNTLDGIFKKNTIDRIDSNKGYTVNNTVSCCKICNKAKLTMSKDVFLNWISRVYNYQNKKGSSTIPHEGSTLK